MKQMTDKDILISDLNDISEILNNNGYGGWCVRIRKAVELLKEQEEKTGEWIYKHDNLWRCSKCGEIIYSNTDDDLEIHHAYCSRCGAKMKQEGR